MKCYLCQWEGLKTKCLVGLVAHEGHILFPISLPSSAVRYGDKRAVCPSVTEIPAPQFFSSSDHQFPCVKGGWGGWPSPQEVVHSLSLFPSELLRPRCGKAFEASWVPSFSSSINGLKSIIQGFTVSAPHWDAVGGVNERH